MTNEKTIAETFAARLGGCGETWTTVDDVHFDDLLTEHAATIIYGQEDFDTAGDSETEYIECCHTEYKAGDPIWHVFADGSAIVETGGWWDIGGKAMFSARGLEETEDAWQAHLESVPGEDYDY